MDTKELTNLADKQWCHVYYKALQFVCVLIWLELDVCWIVFSGDALIYKNILYGFIFIINCPIKHKTFIYVAQSDNSSEPVLAFQYRMIW
jgi:hypothetical protein